MKTLQFIGQHFWIFLAIGLGMGMFYPDFGEPLLVTLVPILQIQLLIIFLKVDLLEVLQSIKDYRLMLSLILVFLILQPILIYWLSLWVLPSLALGFLLIAAMPPGNASPALTDLIKGNTALAVSILICLALICPFTIPLLFSLLTDANVSLDPLAMFSTLAQIIFIPMIVAQPIKYFFGKTVRKLEPAFGGINVLTVMVAVYAALGSQQAYVVANPSDIFVQLIALYLIFILFHIVGCLVAAGRPKRDQAAVAVTNSYMNNGLAIVLAAQFFSAEIVVLSVLTVFPWNTLLAPFQWVLNRFSRK